MRNRMTEMTNQQQTDTNIQKTFKIIKQFNDYVNE